MRGSRQMRKAMSNMSSRQKARFARDYRRARTRSPARAIAIIVLLLLLLFFLAPYFF